MSKTLTTGQKLPADNPATKSEYVGIVEPHGKAPAHQYFTASTPEEFHQESAKIRQEAGEAPVRFYQTGRTFVSDTTAVVPDVLKLPETATEDNPFLMEGWNLDLSWPELHFLQSVRVGHHLTHELYNPAFVAGMLTPDFGCTLESVAKERAQWEEAWADFKEDARRLLGESDKSNVGAINVNGLPRPQYQAFDLFSVFALALAAGEEQESFCKDWGLSRNQYERYLRAWESIQAVHEEARKGGGASHA